MRRNIYHLAVSSALLVFSFVGGAAFAQDEDSTRTVSLPSELGNLSVTIPAEWVVEVDSEVILIGSDADALNQLDANNPQLIGAAVGMSIAQPGYLEANDIDTTLKLEDILAGLFREAELELVIEVIDDLPYPTIRSAIPAPDLLNDFSYVYLIDFETTILLVTLWVMAVKPISSKFSRF